MALSVPSAPPPPPVLDFLPQSLNYQLPQGVGMPHKLKLARWFPFGNTVGPSSSNDIIRFHVKTNDFWDPYSAYLRLEVEIPIDTLTDSPNAFNHFVAAANDDANMNNMHKKVVQLDGCGQSLIQSMIITEQGNELERIMHYDVIANMIKDMSYGRTIRTTKDHEGLGGQIGTNFTNNVTAMKRFSEMSMDHDANQNLAAYNAILARPTAYFNPMVNYNRMRPPRTNNINAMTGNAANNGLFDDWGLVNAYLDTVWPYQNRPMTSAAVADAQGATGNGPFVPLNMLHGCPNLGFETYYGAGFVTGAPNNSNTLANSAYPGDGNNVGQFGYINPFPANFGTTTFEPMFSAQRQRCIHNGVPDCQPLNKITLYLPLMSGIFGCLMQPNNYKLIPMVAFKDLIFEFQFNPYAFFTSWSDTNYSSRKYRINACELHCELAEFMDLTVIRATNEALRNGFTLATQSYYMGPIYNFSQNNLPPTIQINLGFDSLRSIYMVILAGDYLRNSMYRKHYRLSGNITSFQLKIGTDYYPSLPIKGHAGCNYGSNNNYEFYIHMLKSFGKLTTGEELAVNPHNFAINWRETYMAEKDSKTNAGAIRAPNDPAGTSYNNPSLFVMTGAQLSFFFENRIIGKAIFGLDLDSLNYENAILSGIRTTDAKPFEILLDKDTSSYYDGNSIIHIICYYDSVISFVNGEVKALGKA